MAGQPYELLTGGAGMYGTVAPSSTNAAVATGAGVQPHHSVICMVAFAVLILFLLDRAGFRFAVTTGRR